MLQTETDPELSHLNQKNKVQSAEDAVPFSKLLSFASPNDKLLMCIGSLAAFANGAAMPLFSLIFGEMTDSFAPNASADIVLEKAAMNAIWFCIVGLGTMMMSFIMFSTWMITGERQAIEFRKNYFSKILQQEIGWFDILNPNELASKVANETFAVQGAIGEKVPTFIMTFSMTFFGFLVGFLRGWQLALVISATLPAMSIAASLMTVVIQNKTVACSSGYSMAGASAEQALNSIKTVKMLDGEDFECLKYSEHLHKAAVTTIKFGTLLGFTMGLVWCVMILSYALGFWYGSKLISDGTMNSNQNRGYTAGDVLVIFFAILTGGFSLGQAGPCLQNFSAGKVAALKIFSVIERKPLIQNPTNPKKITQLQGEILIQNVEFTYPNRQEVKVLKSLNLRIPAGKKVALVGESGCGKSTVMQIIERFYDCDSGSVSIDGIDIRDFNLEDLRGRIGYVGQEPVLFATSIRENLIYGKKTATESEMIEALKEANAWDFIQKLDKGLDTYVGIGGGQLSGGQKQRIAIARALLKKPQILLLDEATSALDRTNELLIQNTLDTISKGITTIVVAHRLSTIQNADIIYVIDSGVCVEQGTHIELINAHGKYESLAKNQFAALEENIQQNQVTEATKEAKISQSHQQNPLANQGKLLPLLIEEGNKIKANNDQFRQSDSNLGKVHDSQLPNQDIAQVNSADLKAQDDILMARLFSYNKDERLFFYVGILAAMGNGCVFPIFSLFLSEMINVLSQLDPQTFPPEQRESKMAQVHKEADMIAIWFVIISISALILWTLQISLMTYVGEKMTYKVRLETYRKILRLPIPFYDLPENNAGTLTSRLSVDASLINTLTSSTIGINVMNISSLCCGMIIAFISSWALTLVSLGLSPLVFIGGLLQVQFMQGFSDLSDSAYKDSSNLIMEAVCNIRTVQSFGNHDIIMGIYERKVAEPMQRARQKGIYAGLAFGFSQMQMFVIYAIVFYSNIYRLFILYLVGALLHKHQGLSVLDMFKSIFGIMFATFGMGNNQHFAGDIGASKNAAKNLFKILDTEDEFQMEISRNSKKLKNRIQGKIEIKNISFKYNSRETNLFDDLSLIVPEGKKVSFVGPSGCGKSTITQMLLRFYEPQSGEILIDGVNIIDYDLRSLRKQFAIVSQEPVLFSCSIKDNIQYNEKVSFEQIKDAADQANALQFIQNNQFEEINKNLNIGKGFDRQVGSKGSQISGGQKQRIAIARAILRNSNVLLLDEATSALDAATEKLVQQSLNMLMENKTTIAIAHRISTIKDSQIIYVFEEGKIVEQGTYSHLVSLKGFFYRLEQGIQQNKQ